jgi:pyruvate dehydrogenase E2 component (dihydrolipoamide acetyltransferase)
MSEPLTETLKGNFETVRLSRSQRLIAERMVQTKSVVPDFTVSVDARMDALALIRDGDKRERAEQGGTPTVNDFIVKACAVALREHPRVNGSFVDGTLELYERVNIGIAVAYGDSLAVPVVMDADRKSVDEIAIETRRLIARVKDRSIRPDEFEGGTFTISNLGMTGVRGFTAIINAPQAAILAVGGARRMLNEEHGSLVHETWADLTLTCDHRVLYGGHGAAFLMTLRDVIQDPGQLARS